LKGTLLHRHEHRHHQYQVRLDAEQFELGHDGNLQYEGQQDRTGQEELAVAAH
jgi:hypothetical protein